MLERGQSFPLGATVHAGGVNFSVYSRDAESVELLLFDAADAGRPAQTIPLDPTLNRTYHYWHTFVPGLAAGQIYGFRVHGPFDPERGHRFDADKVLLDPYSRAVAVPDGYSRGAASRPGDNMPVAMKSVIVDPRTYDWEGDRPLRRPFSETVIYEMHVGGFTKNPNSGVRPELRGTYAGLIEKIPYLKDLSVNAVELMPVFQFDRQDAPLGLVNYWGYAPVSFFAPHLAYSSKADPLAAVTEFRDLVKALHRAGIEVILDVVFNHTAEGNHEGPTLCFRGFDNGAYYLLEDDRSRYANYSGTGNTLRSNHPVVRRMIIRSLKYWVREMHVDGFRFDLASILSRDEAGRPMKNPPILWDIESDPVLAGVKLIAEAWDPGGLYQVGKFLGDSWTEWNGRFRDDVRDFVRGWPGSVSKMAARVLASPDLYAGEEREPEQSVNFVTCHDGFTLNDLVSYNRKHNEANGEGSRDGTEDNRSWNCGAEGPSDDPEVEKLRTKQIKNYFTITVLSLGAPMILMGDEVRRTQLGNNNAYGQDNELSWFDWSLLEKHADIRRFVRLLVGYRIRRDYAMKGGGRSLNQLLREARVDWHGVKLGEPDWSDDSQILALTAHDPDGRHGYHCILNSYWEPLEFELPPFPPDTREAWRRLIDTGLEPPHDIAEPKKAALVRGPTYLAQPRSVVVLFLGEDREKQVSPDFFSVMPPRS